jgi:hypothetical protein
MRWVLIIVCSIVGAALLLTVLPHSQFQPYSFPGGVRGPNPPHSFPGGVRGPNPFPPTIQPFPGSIPPRPSVPPVTWLVKLGVIALGVLLLAHPWFRQSERGQGIVVTLITSGALALLGQTVS